MNAQLRLDTLPPEVISRVCSNLPPSSIHSLTSTCRNFAYASSISSPSNLSPLWQDAYHLRFGSHTHHDMYSWPLRFYLRHYIQSHWLYSAAPILKLEESYKNSTGSFITATEDALHIIHNRSSESTLRTLPFSNLPKLKDTEPIHLQNLSDSLETTIKHYRCRITAISTEPISHPSCLPLASHDGRIHFHSLKSSNPTQRKHAHRKSLTLRTRLFDITHIVPLPQINTSSSSTCLALGDIGGAIRIIHTKCPTKQHFLPTHFNSPVFAIRTFPSSEHHVMHIVGAGGSRAIQYDVETNKLIGQIHMDERITGLETSGWKNNSNSKNSMNPLVYISGNKNIYVLDNRMESIAAILEIPKYGKINGFVLDQDETIYAQVGSKVIVWDCRGSWLGNVYAKCKNDITCLNLHSNDENCVVFGGCKDGSVKMFHESRVHTLRKAPPRNKQSPISRIVVRDDWIFFSTVDSEVFASSRGGHPNWDLAADIVLH